MSHSKLKIHHDQSVSFFISKNPSLPFFIPSKSSSSINLSLSTNLSCTFPLHLKLNFFFLFLLIILQFSSSSSQTISTNMPLPPMEWIKLKPSGSTSPPPLSYGCLSGPTFYDSSSSGSRQAFLFGGRSEAGTPSNQIYILDYSSQSTSWSQPPATTSTLFTSSPQSRSHLLCGWDRSSNFRNQLNIFGGRSEDGQPLGDFWFYDATNNFWSQPKDASSSNHSAIYGAIGGMDPTFLPSPPATSNAMVYVGGASSSHSSDNLNPSALSIDGQLGSNTNTVQLSYLNLVAGLSGNASASNLLQGRWGMTGTVMPDLKIVVFSGCNGDPSNEFQNSPDPSCSLLNGGILQFQSGFSPSKLNTNSSIPKSSWTSFSYCPAPRVGGTMVPNLNRFDSSYSHQVIMIGGRTDNKNWDDQGGSQLGEVDVLDISSGVWSRVLPMLRDNATFTQKEGLLALALPFPVGPHDASASNSPTDILVYGGMDVSTGQSSNELWILRLHPAKLTGNGSADGITMSYLPSCVNPTPLNTVINSTVSLPGDDRIPSGSPQPPPAHLIFSSLALAMIMLALTILRYEEPGQSSKKKGWRDPRSWLVVGGWNILLISYGLLLVGIVIAPFQSRDTALPSLTKRSLFTGNSFYRKLSVKHVLSGSSHARLGLVVGFAALILVPAFYFLSWFDEWLEDRRQEQLSSGGPRKLKAKGSQRPELKRRTLGHLARLTQSLTRSKISEKDSSTRPDSTSHHQLESAREKNSNTLLEQELFTSSSRETSPRFPPTALEPSSHERLGSTSTACTSDQPLAKAEGFEKTGQHGQLITTAVSLPKSPSQPQLKPLTSSPLGRPLIRPLSLPFSKVFHNLTSSFFTPTTPDDPNQTSADTSDNLNTTMANPSSSISASSAFEVINRKPPSRQQRGINGSRSRTTRVSLDILSDSGSSQSTPFEVLRPNFGAGSTAKKPGLEVKDRTVVAMKDRDYSEVSAQDHSEEHCVEEEEDDDDDSEYHKQIKARRKMRRLADMMLHFILLITNVYLISACFMSTRDLKWLGIVYTCFCLMCYFVMLWLAWIGKTSSESTLVIFTSIIKDGSKSLMRNDNLAGLGQFSSFRQQQQQQQAHQMLAQQMMGSQVGDGGTMSAGADSRMVMARRLQALSFYSASQKSASAPGSLARNPDYSSGLGGVPHGLISSISPTETDFLNGGGSSHNHSTFMGSSGLLGYPNHSLHGITAGQWERSLGEGEELFPSADPTQPTGGMDLVTRGASEDGPDRQELGDDESFVDQLGSLREDRRMKKKASSPWSDDRHEIEDNDDHEQKRRSALDESYLTEREVQIVTTAPKRILTVVNA